MAGRIIFISGTDTDSGKTVVTAALAAAMLRAGITTLVCKPVETGCAAASDGTLLAGDAARLHDAVDSRQPLDEIGPCRFPLPLAPSVAAASFGTAIDISKLQAHIKALAERAEVLLVEGTGGLLVPLAPGYSVLDLAKDCSSELLLVVGSRLGAINHALLSIALIKQRSVPLLGYVFNDLFASEAALSDPYQAAALVSNRQAIREEASRYDTEELAYFPYLTQPYSRDAGTELFAPFIASLRPWAAS